MEEQLEEQVVETAPEATEVVETQDSSPEVEVEAAAPEWTPNYKYRVLDQEKEIDETFREFIKDSETEKRFKDVFTKADAMEHFKSKYATIEQDYQKTSQEYQEVQEAISQLKNYWGTDKDAFFDAMGIDPKQVYAWVADKVKYMDLPPEQKAMYDETRQTKLRNLSMEQENAKYRNMMAQQQLQARSFELDQGIASSQVSNVAGAYDEIYGQGSFRNAVIEHGALQHQITGRDLTPSEALSAVYTKAKVLVDRLGGVGAQQGQRAEPKVISSVRSGGASPAKRKVTSLDDLKKLASQMQD